MVPPASLQFGWRERAALPQLKIRRLRVKVDSGARTSTLHAFPIEPVERNGEAWVRFGLHLSYSEPDRIHWCEAPLIDKRMIKNSNGFSEERYVIATTVCVGEYCWPIAVTLTNRSTMTFLMLLGRSALPSGARINPHASWLQGMPRRARLPQPLPDESAR